MPLGQYKKKRSFDRTPEPSGDKSNRHDSRPKFVGKVRPPKTKEPRFVVQKHAASHLHYDFRLELDGVLVSWAVPKGPSLDPSVKRLAMKVEDHPLDYMTFEGTIPKGNYGAGEVIVWDLGVYHPMSKMKPGLHKGHIDVLLYGEKLKGLVSLVKLKKETDDNAWLLIKQKDEYATKEDITKRTDSVLRKAESRKPKAMPHDIRPMLATLTEKAFNRAGWIFEIKWDGYRAITEIEQAKNKKEKTSVKIYSRKGNSFNKKYPSIVRALESSVSKDAIFDGEIVAIKNGRPDFHELQNYEETQAPLQYVIFDLLYWDGKDLRERPLVERKAILKKNFPRHEQLIYCEHIEEKGLDFFELVKKEGFEGIVAKDGSSIYREGSRSPSWLKIKHQNTQEAIIIGYTEPRGSRKKFGALVLGAYDRPPAEGGHIKYIGHSGGGFTDKELTEMYKLLSKIKSEQAPINEKITINSPITWVKAKYVAEMAFSEWTPDGRMRHPVWRGLRQDKDPGEVIIERNKPEMTGVKKQSTKNNISGSVQNFTHLDKIFWPDERYTKGDVIEYYEKIGEFILPYLKDRPENLLRHPNGIKGKSFFQKDVGELNLPDFTNTSGIYSESNEKEIDYLLCQNKETLLYMANLGCIEINPWNSRVQSIDKPDYMIIDLDPGKNTFDQLVEVAQIAHKVLTEACEEHYIKTSGKRGLHIIIPLGAQYNYEMIRQFAELMVRIIHKRIPGITSLERSPAKRRDKIYLDWLQNRRGQTIAAPYSLRPWPKATVSTPLEWKEVKKGLDPSKFNIKTIWKRLEKKGDLFASVLTHKVDLSKSIKCLREMARINETK